MTLSNLIKHYLREVALQQSPATLRNYTARLNQFQVFVEKQEKDDKPIEKLTVLAWQRSLMDNGLANSTVAQYLTEIKAFFAWVVDNGRYKKNPCDGIKPPKPDAVEKEYLTVEQCRVLLSASAPTPEFATDRDYMRNWVMLALTLTSGIRLDSLIRLRVQDIDFEQGMIRLDKAKGGKTYSVSADDGVLAHVKKYIDHKRPALPSNAPLFVRRLGHAESKKKRQGNVWAVGNGLYAPVCAATFSGRTCPKYTKAICGHAVTAHELRHSTAMYLLEGGAPSQAIQQQLGHSSLIVTEKYLHGLRPSTVKAVTQGIWSLAN